MSPRCPGSVAAEGDLPRDQKDNAATCSSEITAHAEAFEPPEGGLRAWLVVAGAFFIWLNSWGAINAFGVFQSFYQWHLLPSYSASQIAWIGSVQNCLVLLVGFLSAPLYDTGHGPHLLFSGALLTILGYLALSFTHNDQYHQAFLSQAICVGLGWGLMFTPAALLPTRFFKRKLPLATGVASAGTGIGGIIYSVTFARLSQSRIGFPWTVRVLGLIAFATLAFSLMTMTKKAQSQRRRAFIDWTAFQDASYSIWVVGGFLTMAGIQVPYYYAALYAIDTGLTSNESGFYVMTVMNAGSFFGRLVLPWAASLIGVDNAYMLAYAGTSTACFCFIAARSEGLVFTVAVLYGFFSGGLVALSTVVSARIIPKSSLVGASVGMNFAISSIGVLLGGPISGAIMTDDFTYVWIFSGTCLAIGGILARTSRFVLTESKSLRNS